MASSKVAVLGGSGFLGRVIVSQLLAKGYGVRVVTRDATRAPSGVDTVVTDVVHGGDEAMRSAIEGCDKVVNLIGLLFETSSRGATFENAHVGVATALTNTLTESQQLVQISAIGADKNAKSKYASTKGRAEQLLLNTKQACVLRPSIVYGPEDGFFNRFASMTRWSPFLPLVGGGTTKYQPVHVEDLAKLVLKVLEEDGGDMSKVYEVGGNDVREFRELMEMTLRVCGRKRALLSLPYSIANFQGAAFEAMHSALPNIPPLLTRDQVVLLESDNVVTGVCAFEQFDVERRGCTDNDIRYIAP